MTQPLRHRPAAYGAAQLVGFVEYFFRRTDQSGDIFPDDDPHGTVAGARPYRLMVLGENNAIGLGVVSHRLGMAGHLARKLAHRTRYEVQWSAQHVPGNRIARAPAVVNDESPDLSRTDLLVLMLGIVDTLSLTSIKSWTFHLSETLDLLQETLPQNAQILVTHIPPMDNAGSISALARRAAGYQARALNRATNHIVAKTPRCAVVPFPKQLTRELWTPESRETPYVNMYASWATAACDALAL